MKLLEDYNPFEIVNNVKIFREQCDISRAELAQYCSIPMFYMQAIEENHCNVSLTIALLISEKLDVPVNDLFSITAFCDDVY